MQEGFFGLFFFSNVSAHYFIDDHDWKILQQYTNCLVPILIIFCKYQVANIYLVEQICRGFHDILFHYKKLYWDLSKVFLLSVQFVKM